MEATSIESPLKYALRMFGAVIAIDAAAAGLAALGCIVFRVELNLDNFSSALFITGFILAPFAVQDRLMQPARGPAGYDRLMEPRLPARYDPSVFSGASIGIASLVAIVSSVVLPLVF